MIEGASAWATRQAAPEDIARAVRRLLEAIARESPLVLVLEDIHWGEPALLDLSTISLSQPAARRSCCSASHGPSCSKTARPGAAAR